MAKYAKQRVESNGVTHALGNEVTNFWRSGNESSMVHTQGGAAYEAELVFLAIGVRPETKLVYDGRVTDSFNSSATKCVQNPVPSCAM
jgi:pyruvate/2-oxoglutarate dehydrogenase complex dihydrolipoamide dehydrogenase (E3) component